MSNRCGEAARVYAQRLGWAVLPVNGIVGGACTCGRGDCPSPGKHPLTKNGVKDATKNPWVIRDWWTRWPHANVAIATGQASQLWVLDVDGQQGRDSLDELESEHGRLPSTVEQITGGGGRHIFFHCPPGLSVSNAVAIRPGLDVRGDGGYVLLPPSLHASGRRYCWEVSSRPNELPIVSAPDWVLALVVKPEVKTPLTPDEWRAIVDRPALEGTRNQTVARIVGHLLRKSVDPWVTLSLARAWNKANCKPPLADGEVLQIVESLADKELRRRGAG